MADLFKLGDKVVAKPLDVNGDPWPLSYWQHELRSGLKPLTITKIQDCGNRQQLYCKELPVDNHLWDTEVALASTSNQVGSIQQAVQQAHQQAQSSTPSTPIGQSLNAQPTGSNAGITHIQKYLIGTSVYSKTVPYLNTAGVIRSWNSITGLYDIDWTNGKTSWGYTEATVDNLIPLPPFNSTSSTLQPRHGYQNNMQGRWLPIDNPTKVDPKVLPYKSKVVKCDCGSICDKCWV